GVLRLALHEPARPRESFLRRATTGDSMKRACPVSAVVLAVVAVLTASSAAASMMLGVRLGAALSEVDNRAPGE
ncbi:MAG TPA: hypothetical protein VF972_01655, partial [Actinomycetota bacterium]